MYVEEFLSSEFQRLNAHRDKSVQNMDDWSKMNSGEIDEGDAVVRVKTEMDLPNPALRDWPALRIQHSRIL